MPYCFSRSSVKFQGHTALKIVEFDPNWAFPDCNSSLNSPMTMKCCTKLETAKERCPIVFQGHLSNFKVTRYKTSPILTQIGYFRTVGRSQLSNPSDLPCFTMILYFCLKLFQCNRYFASTTDTDSLVCKYHISKSHSAEYVPRHSQLCVAYRSFVDSAIRFLLCLSIFCKHY